MEVLIVNTNRGILQWLSQAVFYFRKGFNRGLKVNPWSYFAPLIAVWDLLVSTTESLLDTEPRHHGR